MNQPEQVLKAQNRLGETPVWEPDEQAVYWVDWGKGSVYRFETGSGKFTTFNVDLLVTAIARRASGGFVLIAQDGIYSWDPTTNISRVIVGPPQPDKPEICYNDGAADIQGRLLVGTVNMENPYAPEGSLYRLDPDGSLHVLDTGYATANGIGISPDGERVYVTDMRHNQIVVLDYDASLGTVCNRRLFARVQADRVHLCPEETVRNPDIFA